VDTNGKVISCTALKNPKQRGKSGSNAGNSISADIKKSKGSVESQRMNNILKVMEANSTKDKPGN